MQEQEAQEQQPRPPAIAVPPGAPITSLQQLPTDIRNATALLEAPNPSAPGGSTRVWVLGASHVSQVSCRQIKDLIRAVKPEVCVRAYDVPEWKETSCGPGGGGTALAGGRSAGRPVCERPGHTGTQQQGGCLQQSGPCGGYIGVARTNTAVLCVCMCVQLLARHTHTPLLTLLLSAPFRL